MSTPFTDIYELNSAIQLDTRLNGKPDNLLYSLKYKWLQFAISYFKNDCYKNLEDTTPFSQIEYEFNGNGSTNNFILTPAPPISSRFYVSVDDSLQDYTFNFNTDTNTMTISPNPTGEVYISAYIIGEFKADLNVTEKAILSEGMNIPWLEQQRNRSDLLNQMVYNGDFKMYSQANHIDALNNTIDNQYLKNVKSMINAYTWKENPKGLLGLGGGLK